MIRWNVCLLFFYTLLSWGFKPGAGRVSASVYNIRNNKGVCRICLYNNADAFAGKGAPLKCATVSISGKSAYAAFEDLPVGEYAISVIHDENNNNAFDKNFLGIPKEGYGASGNNLPFASAPEFKDNKFRVNANQVTLKIRLRYL